MIINSPKISNNLNKSVDEGPFDFREGKQKGLLNDNSKSSITPVPVISNSEARAKSLHSMKYEPKEDDTANKVSSRNSARDKKKSSLFKDKKKKKEKVVITGDDILIEYVRRLKNSVLKQKQHG